MGACIQREDVSDEGSLFACTSGQNIVNQLVHHQHITLTSDHVRDLDDWVNLSLGENALATRTFDIEAQNSEWGNVGPIALRRMGDEVVITRGRGQSL